MVEEEGLALWPSQAVTRLSLFLALLSSPWEKTLEPRWLTEFTASWSALCLSLSLLKPLSLSLSVSLQLHYGEPVIRRAVPLALALLSTSHPQLSIIDTLHKFSHDSDPTVARSTTLTAAASLTCFQEIDTNFDVP